MLVGPYQGLQCLREAISAIVERQRRFLGRGGVADDEVPDDSEVPPESDEEAPNRCLSDPAEPHIEAYFASSDRWRRPSDYVAHLAGLFEAGLTGEKDGKPKSLKRDQSLFLAQFASACNAIWDDEQNAVPMAKRRRFNLLLMGQGGSGKTAIVQDIVLSTMNFLFPPTETGKSSSLIVCAKWSQAENISTPTNKAISCHRAGLIGVQSFRNAHMHPGDKKVALERNWAHLRMLVVEEVSMISPALYNMLLYRSFHGRSRAWEVSESMYDKPSGAFGRMPIVIHLGDFLQLKPTNGLSLLENLRKLEAEGKLQDFPPVQHGEEIIL